MSKYHRFQIKGLDCPTCALKIQNELKTIEGFDFVDINFQTATLVTNSADIQKINHIIHTIEPDVSISELIDRHNGSFTDYKFELLQIFIASGFFVIGVTLERITDISQSLLLIDLSYIFSYLIAGYLVIYKALFGLKHGKFADENFLMSIATIGAVMLHEIPEAAMVMLLYDIGQYFQHRAVARSRNAIQDLLDILPDQAHVVQPDGTVSTVLAEAVNEGTVLLIKPGERVPLDGKVISGNSTVDLSALTGESQPKHVKEGDELLSGAINHDRSLQIQVIRSFQESTVSRILQAVETATTKKAQTELFITRFAQYYTPFIIVMALCIAIIPSLIFQNEQSSVWIYRALVVLVISCPCALVISIPLSYFAGLGLSSRKGVLLKGANVIDSLNKTSLLLFDKTGTLTEGEFKVSQIIAAPNYTEQDVLKYAAIAEAHSNHPIAVSIRNAYNKENDSKIDNYEELPALGVKTSTSMGTIWVGNDKFLHHHDIIHGECIDECTVVYVILNKNYIGHIIIEDKLRHDADFAVKQLRKMQIEVGLVTGDTYEVASRVGNQLGISKDHIFASLLPLNKVEIVEQQLSRIARGKKVAFAGDGINDAPVLVRSDVGIAMGGIGSDAAIDAADVVIMDDQLSKIPQAIIDAKRTTGIVKQNIVMAIGVKFAFIILGIAGIATMWLAVIGDVGVTLLTIANALRLLKK